MEWSILLFKIWDNWILLNRYQKEVFTSFGHDLSLIPTGIYFKVYSVKPELWYVKVCIKYTICETEGRTYLVKKIAKRNNFHFQPNAYLSFFDMIFILIVCLLLALHNVHQYLFMRHTWGLFFISSKSHMSSKNMYRLSVSNIY